MMVGPEEDSKMGGIHPNLLLLWLDVSDARAEGYYNICSFIQYE